MRLYSCRRTEYPCRFCPAFAVMWVIQTLDAVFLRRNGLKQPRVRFKLSPDVFGWQYGEGEYAWLLQLLTNLTAEKTPSSVVFPSPLNSNFHISHLVFRSCRPFEKERMHIIFAHIECDSRSSAAFSIATAIVPRGPAVHHINPCFASFSIAP